MDFSYGIAAGNIKLRDRIISTLNTGDLVRTKSIYPFIFHYGIVCREGKDFYVYHNDPDMSNHAGGNIIRENFMDWIQDREIVEVKSTGLDITNIETVVKELKCQKYDLLNFNCEHFITKLKGVKPSSAQVINWGVMIGVVTLAIIIIRNRK